MEYARIQTSTGALQEIREFGVSRPEPMAIAHKDIDWRPVTRTIPSVDGAAQLREGPFTTVFADRVEIVYIVRAKTQEELDAEKNAIITRALDRVDALKAVANALFTVINDVRALKGQTTITATQYRAYLKSLL